MLTVEEIVALAAHAAAGGRNFVFRDLAIAVGIHSRNGWIYLPAGTRPAAHGWQAFAKIMSGERVGWTGRALLVEMSKASVSSADLAAAEREAHVMLPDCDCVGLTGPDGAHAVACRRGEAIRRRGITTEHDEQAAAYAAALREYHERARRGPADEGRYPFERENRIAVAYTLFADLADSGGPGTAKGLRAAVESASTVTETQLVHAARGMIAKLNTIGLSTPVRVNPHTFASILAGELASLGFDVK